MDFRSDTLTQPTQAMRQAMAQAPVGDDVFSEDPTVRALEDKGAELLGHEAALFCVSGSMANMLGLWLNVDYGTEVLCDQKAHIVRAEMGAHAALHGIQTKSWTTDDGVSTLEDIEPLVSLTGGFLVRTSTVEIENTMNFASGAIQPLENYTQIAKYCQDNDLRLHLDGARLANACVATQTSLADYGKQASTVSLCLSKGLGAPVGTLLASTKANIDQARVQRKRLGGGWRQAGILAAAGIYALDHHIKRLAEDHEGASLFADQVRVAAPWAVTESIPTNIVVIQTGSLDADQVILDVAQQGVKLTKLGPHIVRAVSYLGVSREQCIEGGKVTASVLGQANPR
ncbi:MAG: threonine aldolase family protein [Propionibacteriaceae bacterium]|nr:threonine aldolase family protein [Propionibacteriaceae bacterium]